jgi:hypothetical protein
VLAGVSCSDSSLPMAVEVFSVSMVIILLYSSLMIEVFIVVFPALFFIT